VISIKTTRFSTVVKAFLERHPKAIARLDRKIQHDDASLWCTNANLQAAKDFTLVDDGAKLLGFHDGPTNMLAAEEMMPLVQTLAEKKVLRLRRPAPRKPGLLSRLFRRARDA
jgi:hypothetical protein